jgi:hypothetical protein
VAALPALTSSRLGDIPLGDIDAAFSASVAAVREMAALGVGLAVPLLEYGERGDPHSHLHSSPGHQSPAAGRLYCLRAGCRI